MTRLILKKKTNDYADVNTYTFSPSSPIAFHAGQFCHLLIPRLSLFPRWTRHISFASSPTDADVVFSIDASSNSSWHRAMKSLKEGGSVVAYGVHGRLSFPEDVHRPTVCIAGGVGATPFRSLFRSARAEKSTRKITFVHVASHGFLYEEEFSGYPIAQYRIGRRDVDATLEKVISENPRGRYLISGAPRFARAMAEKIMALGVPPEEILSDDFRRLRVRTRKLRTSRNDQVS